MGHQKKIILFCPSGRPDVTDGTRLSAEFTDEFMSKSFLRKLVDFSGVMM